LRALTNKYVDILLPNNFFLICEIVGDEFYYIRQYIGPEKEASQFKYKFVRESGAEEITVCNAVSGYCMDVKKMYNMGKCVELFCDTMERFLDGEKNLQFHIALFKNKEAHEILLL